MKVELGDKAKDVITGHEGIVTGMFHYLNGCVRVALIAQKLSADNKAVELVFDIEQVEVVEKGAFKKKAVPTGGPMPDPPAR